MLLEDELPHRRGIQAEADLARVVLARDNKLSLKDLPATMDNGRTAKAGVDIPSGITLQQLERTAVQQALGQCDGNRTHAAHLLGISVRTLQRKLKAWGIEQGPDV